MPSFEELGLSGPVLRAITRTGYTEPTAIQAQAIPVALEGKDIVGASQTGTGKTAAFGLPIICQMKPSTRPQCIVLEPTRELAAQVEDQMNVFSYYKPLNVVLLHGGVGYGHQIEALENKPDVIIATPGRMLDQKIDPPRDQLLTDARVDRDFTAHPRAGPARFEIVVEPVARTQHIVGLHLVHVPALQDRQGKR